VRIADDLDLDVPRRRDVALDEERVVAEGALRLAPRRLERGREVRRRGDEPHAAATASRRGLHEEREADLPRAVGDVPIGEPIEREAGYDGDARRLHDALRLDLAPH